MARADRFWTGATRGVGAALVVACASLAGTAEGGPRDGWPRWRGAGFDGSAAQAGVFAGEFGLRVRWRRAVGSGYSGVVVAEGRAVTMFSDGERDFVVALDADTGREAWRLEVAPSRPGIEGSNPGPISTPAIDAGRVYALGPRGHLVAARLVDGAPLWRVDLVETLGAATPHWGFGTSPLVWGEHVLVEAGAPGQRAIAAFDRDTGAVAWSALDDGVNYQSPLLWTDADGTRLLFAGDATLAALDPADGRVHWSQPHEGLQFYRQIVNPVRVGDDALLLTHRRDQATLYRVGPGGVESVWSSGELKLNYATPVYSDGHVYGYSGNFLTCIDAATGERVWKSRPPGNGFPILVDGHLVVQTKQGSLHVAEASPEGYRERAQLAVFERLVWTPPSFADGRIYARDSFSEVVAVDVVPGGAAPATADAAVGTLPGSRFAAWVTEVESSADPRARVRAWLAEQSRFPVIEGDRIAHVVYEGEVRDLALRGALLTGVGELPMHRVERTDLYYASFELEPDARLVYQLRRDLEDPIADPRNPPAVDSLVYGGPASLLQMPGAPPYGVPTPSEAQRGRVETLPHRDEPVLVGARTWGGRERPLQVHLPAGYDAAPERRYPVLYVLYGEQMRDPGRLDVLIDSLVAEGRLEPLIAVFVPSTSAYEYARSQREPHARMLVEELVPLVDRSYRTRAEPDARALLGVDEAGYAALEIAFRHPGRFGAVAAQSVLAIAQGREELLAAIDAAPRQPLRLYLDWGRYDLRDPSDGTDVPGYGRLLRERLEARGYAVHGREWNDGSDALLWVARAGEALPAVLP